METMRSAVRRAGRNWGWVLLYGLLLIVTGFFAMVDPVATGLAVGIILAISFFVGGVGALIAAFRDAGWQAKTVDVLFGIMSLLAGVICLVNPFGGATTLVWVIGILFLISGGYEIAAGFKADSEKAWLILLGILDLFIGLYATFLMPPDTALVVLATLVGIGFLFRGLLISTLAFRLRGLAKP